MGAEKRRYRRLETNLEARLKNLSDPDGANFGVRIVNLGPEGEIDCPYCGRHFVRKEGAPAHAHH